MPITYSFDARQGLIKTVATGEIGVADIEAHLRQITAEPWFPASALADVRETSPNVSSEEVRAIVALFRLLGPRLQGSPIAVLVGSDAAYGLVRMIELLLDDVVTITPFRDQAAAITWLSQHKLSEKRPRA
jgi:hypothetical protein